jgi:hypothetical protein
LIYWASLPWKSTNQDAFCSFPELTDTGLL